jgi:cytochrome c5
VRPRPLYRVLLFLNVCIAGAAFCAPGEQIYREKCSLCHDGGAGQAPRIGSPEDWKARFPRGRDALMRSAILGVPGTAMAPRGGFAELGDADIGRAVDHMLGKLGFDGNADLAKGPAQIAKAPAGNGSAPERPMMAVDDAALVASVAEALRHEIAPRGAIDTSNGTRIAGIKVESRNGVVSLRGIVDDAKVARRAAEIAQQVPGVVQVENNLGSAAIFEWD